MCRRCEMIYEHTHDRHGQSFNQSRIHGWAVKTAGERYRVAGRPVGGQQHTGDLWLSILVKRDVRSRLLLNVARKKLQSIIAVLRLPPFPCLSQTPTQFRPQEVIMSLILLLQSDMVSSFIYLCVCNNGIYINQNPFCRIRRIKILWDFEKQRDHRISARRLIELVITKKT